MNAQDASTATASETVDPKAAHVAGELAHESPLISCRFDPTGRYAFAGAQDSRVWRWDLQTQAKAELKGHDSWVRALGFAASGGALLTGGYDGRLVWWEAAAKAPQPLRTVEAHDGWIRALSVNSDSTLIATVGNDLLVKLWDLADGKLVHQLKGHDAHIYNVAFHPSGEHLVSGDLMGRFRQWEVASGEQVDEFTVEALTKYDTTFRADIGGPRAMSFRSDGTQLAVGGITNVSNAFAGVGNPWVEVLEWPGGKSKGQHGAKGDIRGVLWDVVFHPQDFVIGASGGSSGGFLLFWKPGEKEPFHQMKLPQTLRGFDMAPDATQLATAHGDGKLLLTKLTPAADAKK